MSLLLALFLAAPGYGYPVHAQHPYAQFRALVAQATEGVGLKSSPKVRQGISPWPGGERWVAWVLPSEPIIWINPGHLDKPVGELCDTAYHEVVHLWLAEEGIEDEDHEEHESWMTFFMVEDRCKGDDPDWAGVGYEEYLE